LIPEKRKTIYRTPKRRRYVVVDNEVFEDTDLSWEARGVMGYLLSKPDHWRVRLHDLRQRGPAGEHKLRRILQELQRAGYLNAQRFRKPDGTFDWEMMIFEDPDDADDVP
jgi:hypothetical protein